jgi:DNA-3-methyladenine glycosylase I
MPCCPWAQGKIYEHYHDTEWGVPCHDERHLFEMLNLEGAQAGLSWITILKKREGYRAVFDNFEPRICASYTDKDLEEKLKDERIIRNRLKVFGVRKNAHAYLKLCEEFGSLDTYLWGFVNGTPIQNRLETMSDIPANTPLSDAISKDLKKRGFTFVGSTIVYAYMQAIGIVNDHLEDCPRWKEVGKYSASGWQVVGM